jgi:hypothetical protein
LKSLIQGSRDGDFAEPIEHALAQYREDAAPANPNQAPREFWPSTCRFRSILYSAGNRLGRDGAIYLDRIPDGDLRLFAQIEFAAALAGLPELQGSQREYRPPRFRSVAVPRTPSDGPAEPRIRCPQCNWAPSPADRWSCKCRHRWNTFSTGGVCPACRYKWEVTACLSCGRPSPHSDWYRRR